MISVKLVDNERVGYFTASSQNEKLPVVHESLSQDKSYSRVTVQGEIVIYQFELNSETHSKG